MIGCDYKWYVAYTRNQHEKKVYEDNLRLNITSFLPLIKKVRYWSDRKKQIEVPLFPNYIFLKLSCREYIKVLEHPSVIGFVKFGKELSSVSEEQIKWIQKITENNIECFLNSTVEKGMPVRVEYGPLKGLRGEVVQTGNKDYVVMYLKQIKQSILVTINKDALMVCN